jgi:adenine-specific DNA-methyltransferase
VDFDQLKQELSESLAEGPQERYHLNWPGKREALLIANAPIAKTMRPSRDESVSFDTTRNLFIEGDNLEALKLMQETYLARVKLIYIDPPYNTGSDFIYRDDFAESVHAYKVRANEKDEQGNRLVQNKSSNGRFHSDWLSLMYSRLRLAHNLLSEDGFIFVSIDDNEQANLCKLGNEVFGESNFVGTISRATGTPTGGGFDGLTNMVDYIHIWRRSYVASLNGLEFGEQDAAIYNETDEKGRFLTRSLRRTGGEDRREDRPSMYYGVQDPDGNLVYPIGPGGYESRWICGKDRFSEMIAEGLVAWRKVDRGNGMEWHPYQKFYLDGRAKRPSNLWTDVDGNKKGTRELRDLFDQEKVFESPKPVGLIQRIIQIATDRDSIVMDFFAGSCSTAHAVMAQNAADNGIRRFIMVQLPEPIPDDHTAKRAGFSTIADVSKERMRRAGSKVLTDSRCKLDVGFRVLKIDTSNMADVFYAPDSLGREKLDLFIENIKPDRKPEDLLFQVMLDWGVDLSLPVETRSIQGKDVFFVDSNALAACFDAHSGVDESFVKEVAAFKPLRVVFRDAGFKDSAAKINVEQIFKLLSPATEVKSI